MKNELGGVFGSMEDRRNAYRGLVREREGQRSLGRYQSRWDDIKLGLKAIESDDVDWIYLAQDKDKRRAFVKAVMQLYGANALTS
jgi:hypothetical protein